MIASLSPRHALLAWAFALMPMSAQSTPSASSAASATEAAVASTTRAPQRQPVAARSVAGAAPKRRAKLAKTRR